MLNIQELHINCPEVEYVLGAASDHALGTDNAFISFYNAQNGTPVNTTPIIEDFGDIAPFLWLCGGQELARKEFEAVYATLQRDILHINPRRSRQWIVHTYDWTDLLLGLMDYYEISEDIRALEKARELFTLWQEIFCHDEAVAGQAVKFNDMLYAMPISRLLDVGMFPELLIKYASVANSAQTDEMHHQASSIIMHWSKTHFFRETGLFPDTVISPYLGRACLESILSILTGKLWTHQSCTLFKHNTNALASVLSVWQETRDPSLLQIIEKWVQGCRTHLLTSKGQVNMRWHKNKGILKGPTDHNFQVIDLMCDIAYETKESQYLDLAVTVADSWIKLLSPIGFMPHYVGKSKKAQQAMSDSQTDFSVALLKLSALTGKKEYADVAERIMGAVKEYMYLPCGMATWVDVQSGAPINTICKTKFMILSLKGWLALHNQERIYKDEQFTRILSDR